MHKLLTAEKAASHAAWPGARRGAAGGIDGAAARVPEDWLIAPGSGESSSESDGDGDESSSDSDGDGDGGAGSRTVSDGRDSYARRMSDGADFEDDY